MRRIQHAAHSRLHSKAAVVNPLEDKIVPLVLPPFTVRHIRFYPPYAVGDDGIGQPLVQADQPVQHVRTVADIVIDGDNDIFRKVPQCRKQFLVRTYLCRVEPHVEKGAFGFQGFQPSRKLSVRKLLRVQIQYNLIGQHRAAQDGTYRLHGVRNRRRK